MKNNSYYPLKCKICGNLIDELNPYIPGYNFDGVFCILSYCDKHKKWKDNASASL